IFPSPSFKEGYPVQIAKEYCGVYPTNHEPNTPLLILYCCLISFGIFVVPVFPANGNSGIFACVPVPFVTTDFNISVTIYAVQSCITASDFGDSNFFSSPSG